MYNKVNALLFEMQDIFYLATRTLNVYKPFIKCLTDLFFFLPPKVKRISTFKVCNDGLNLQRHRFVLQ